MISILVYLDSEHLFALTCYSQPLMPFFAFIINLIINLPILLLPWWLHLWLFFHYTTVRLSENTSDPVSYTHLTIFKALNIENTQNTKTDTTTTQYNTTLKDQRPTNYLNNIQKPTHKYFTRNKMAKAEDERKGTLETCS